MIPSSLRSSKVSSNLTKDPASAPTREEEEEALAAVPVSASSAYAAELASSSVPCCFSFLQLCFRRYEDPLLDGEPQISREEEQLCRAYDTLCLLPKHKVFISHSGRQKDFAEQLCVDLETHGYYPFFDKRSDSLPKGKEFPRLIFEAASKCLLAIVLISEDFFTRTKWPMLELAAFVKEQKTRKDLCILPVLLGLATEDLLQNTEKWSKQWIKWEKQDPRLTHDVISEWKAAVRALKAWNMIDKRKYDGEVNLRKAIVDAIIKAIPPDIRSHVSNVQGRERLCKEVCSMFDRCPPLTSRVCENASVLGVHGIAGAGKSTLCVITAEYLRKEFLGRVCVAELRKETAPVDIYRQVLKQLCRVDPDFLIKYINTERECVECLEERICRDRVFLAIDNVSDEASIDIASSFLRLKFHPDSKVLVTSRSDDILCRSLGIAEQSCMQCLSLTKEEALEILLEQVNLPSELLNTQQMHVLHEAMELSYFKGYHPMALQLFAAQLGTDQSKWKEIKLDLQWTADLEHRLFSLIETIYLALPDLHTKDIFMDIALFTPEHLCGIDDIICWLTDTVGLDTEHIKQKLQALRVKALLEIWKIEDESFRIHDLYRVFAQRNTSADTKSPRFIYQAGGKAAPTVLLRNEQSQKIEQAMFVDAEFEELKLEACPEMKVLGTRRCEKLRTMCIQKLTYLVSLEVVSACSLESLDVSGLSELRWLHISSCKELTEVILSEVGKLGHVSVSKCGELTKFDLRKCSTVRSVSFMYNDKLGHVNLGNGDNLKCLTLWFCVSLADLEISGVAYLTTLKKRGCPRLMAIKQEGVSLETGGRLSPTFVRGLVMCSDARYLSLEKWGNLSPTFVRGLEMSALLRVLDIWNCCMSRLPDLRSCSSLQALRLSNVDVLLESNFGNLGESSNTDVLCEEYKKIMGLSVDDLVRPLSLKDVCIRNCKRVVEKEIFWKVQGLSNLRIISLQDVRVGWDWELYADSKYALLFKVDKEEIDLRSWFDSMCKMDQKLLMDLQADYRGEVQIVSFAGCFKKIKHCLQVYCHQLSSMDSESKPEFSIPGEMLSRHWKSGVEVDSTLQKSMGCMFWESMSEAVEIKGSVCWIVEQIILQTLNSWDSLCHFMQQERFLRLESWQDVQDVQSVHRRQLFGQLHFLTASCLADIVQHHGMWTVWERMIIDEVSSRRASTMVVNPSRAETVEENGAVAISRLEKLLEGLAFLYACKGWTDRDSFKEPERMRFAWEWLLASRMCLSLEELKNCLVRQSFVRNELELHIEDMQALRKSIIDAVMRKFTDVERGNFADAFELMTFVVRFWNVGQWVQEVESCLSKHLRSQEELLAGNESVRILPAGETLNRVTGLSQRQLSIGRSVYQFGRSFLERKAKSVLETLELYSWSANHYSFYCGIESLRDKHLHWMAESCSEVETFLGQVQECPQIFLDLVIQLDMQLWQYKNFAADCISIGGKKKRWIHTAEKYARTSVEDLPGGADAFVWPCLMSSSAVRVHVRGLIALMKGLCFKMGTSNLPYDLLISRFSVSLRDELNFLLHARIYSSNENELYYWWQSAELSKLWRGLRTFMTWYGPESWLGAESQKALQELLEDLQSAMLEVQCDEKDLIRMEAGINFSVKTLRSPSWSFRKMWAEHS